MKLLIIGHKGQLGYDLQKQADDKGFEYIGLDLPELDITNTIQVEAQIADSKASLVINSAAYTAVDKAESEPDLAFKVNREGAANLATACAKAKIPLSKKFTITHAGTLVRTRNPVSLWKSLSEMIEEKKRECEYENNFFKKKKIEFKRGKMDN